jgi:hypothetical protein
MATIDDDFLKIIQKAKEDEIERKVYEKLKGELRAWKFLGISGSLLGGIIVAILITYHKPIFEGVVRLGGQRFQQSIEASFEKQKALGKEIEASFAATEQFARKELNKLQDFLLTTRSEIDGERVKFQAILKSFHDAQDAATEARDTFVQRVAAAQIGTDEIRRKLDDMIKQVNALVENQGSIVDALGKANAKPDKIAGVQQTAPLPDVKRTTVYFQFAGFERSDATEISRALRQRGWSIPGEERTTAAVNTNEVRFNPADQRIAEQLQKDGNDTLKSYGIELKLSSNRSVTAGIPEIWIFRR